ncbi:erythromycin esterase family protein [Zunongwangia sp. F260]|uniref:Erythromycin esterase family protein n=1 Tax=Autumnicola lenta TaxID=3075593 RepID=A0ABU3CFZ8_9FLAO|nr:erythromycin esterase family protein [Zunongwangia sp. F260]MDT0645275.1 erythromycin esterase family protein [Zunongwangia sp. F260]
MISVKTDNSDLKKYYHNLQNSEDLDPLLDRIGNSKYVLLGEASHGTHEYYAWRAQISKRLIEEKGFSFIAVEGDWPDCYKINKWIKNYPNSGENIQDVLKEFNRWPTWMWANWEIAAFATWLKDHNSKIIDEKKIGFYGLDVYSLWDSMEILVDYLEKEDPETAKVARNAFRCFEPYKERDSYASVFKSAKEGCKAEVVKLLKEVRHNAHSYNTEEEADLNAEINALVMANAEKYYESMAGFGDDSWNVRDRHMVETLNTLMDYHDPDAKVIVWEHNTHVGDARATGMAASGLLNVGQLVREQHNDEGVVLVGFGSYSGSVMAGSSWGAPMQKMKVPKGIEGSLERQLHKSDPADKLIIFDEHPELKEAFSEKIGHRAIGVVYHPDWERGNYVPSRMSDRYDAFLFIDQTEALHPLKIKPQGDLTPETYPFGI